MVAPVPFTMSHVLDTVVEAIVLELTVAQQELATVRAAAATAREVLEARVFELEQQVEELGAELVKARRRIAELEAAPAFRPDELPTGPVQLSPPPPRPATEAERAAPPRNPRLTGLSTLEGMTFGTWFVLGRGASAGSGATYWKCRCVKCGATKELAGVGAFSLRRKPPWCSACRSSAKGRKADGGEQEHDDQEDEGE
jgi:hypothetical protein